VPQFAGQRLVCGFYLNELLLRLSPRDDPSPELFQLYDRTVRSMARADNLADILRRFELNLLAVLGYAPPCAEDAGGQPVQADGYYLCRFGELPQRVAAPAASPRQLVLGGDSLLALASADFTQPHSRRDVRGLLRLYLDELLGPEPLASRELLTTLYALQEDSAPSRRPS
jgi:DNA repair protein RecO (recombination protein O)